MGKNRLEAFSDGVIAIVITIMVLELKVPHENSFAALNSLFPIFLSYVLSFIYIGIYWNNHHHMLHAVKQVNGSALWANLHLLFWLSLIPFVTGWMGENHFARIPVFLYGLVLFMSGIAYYLLSQILILSNDKHSTLAQAVGKDFKTKISLLIYFMAILCALFYPWLAVCLYILVASLWLVPDPRIEKILKK